ncbi:hypothetical protein B0H10DRAFT_2016555 [Mycena sp. CBHHK59/15]|nr:hypothetical protein B0H10DRAFT_2016555 [Mycena sp. CBHHK59/15]
MENSRVAHVLALPSRLFFSVLSTFIAILRPSLPYILPVLVYASFIPLILFLSASAGWIVWRNVAVGWQSPLHLQYGDTPNLVPQQRYDISLHLQVPNIESNYALGNFMTALTLSTRSNKTLVSIRRPAIVIPPRLSFFSTSPAVINVDVPLLSSYASSSSYVIAIVEIGRRDSWKSLGKAEGRELSVASASIRGVVVHHGIRGLATRLPLLSSLISSIVFLVISSLVVGACILPLMFRRTTPVLVEPEVVKVEVQPLPAISSSSSDDSEMTEEKPLIPRRRSTVKSEDEATIIAPSESQSSPLRRRRSKLVDPTSSDSDS